MRDTPEGWPRISTSLYYEDAAAAIAWLCKAFGFSVRNRVEGPEGRIEHSELIFGDGVVMVSQASDKASKFPHRRTPTSLGGGNTQNLFVYVDDVEAHWSQAKAAGARIHSDPQTVDYGADYWTDRGYGCFDLGDHYWYFAQRIETAKHQA